MEVFMRKKRIGQSRKIVEKNSHDCSHTASPYKNISYLLISFYIQSKLKNTKTTVYLHITQIETATGQNRNIPDIFMSF